MTVRHAPALSLLLALAATLCPAPARAGIPSPANSTAPPCLVVCPRGDVEYRVVVRDIANFPLVGSTVAIWLQECPNVVPCATQLAGTSWDPANRYAWTLTGAGGVASFHLKLGGTCANTYARITADGVMLTSASVASPDQDADLFVGGSDVLIVNDLVGTTNRAADFDCDGTVTAADLAFLTDLHGGHSCDPAVSVRHGRWGELKQLYR
jgi:hypothetical protein